MRKYDSKNKKNIGIIIVICIIFAIVFSYFLIREIKISKIEYELEKTTFLFDIDKNSILLNEVATIKKKWNDKYYLTYNEEQYQIGSHVIAFNNNELSLSLYGEFYEVNRNSDINITKEETKLNNLTISRFYKIEDRKYLIVDSSIKSEDSSLETTNYLIVELDKIGNALLYNNNINLKTFRETKLVTSTYTFDIANELLIYEDKTVDLKKILGTTNEYKEEDKKEENEGTGNNNQGDIIGNNGSNNNNGNGNSPENNDQIITDEKGPEISDNEIINQTSQTSIININPTINSINVDYVVYDTMNKYLSTYLEIENNNEIKVIHLSKNTTNISIRDLLPGTEYNLTFKYTHMEDDILKEEKIGEYKVKTLVPDISLKGIKVTNKNIEYEIKIDSYNIDSAKLKVYVDGIQQTEHNINNSTLKGKVDITKIKLDDNSLVELSLEDIYIDSVKIDKPVKWSYKIESKPKTEPKEGDVNE